MYDAFMYVSHTLSNFVLCVPAVSQFDLQSVNQSNFSLIIVTVSLSLSLSHTHGVTLFVHIHVEIPPLRETKLSSFNCLTLLFLLFVFFKNLNCLISSIHWSRHFFAFSNFFWIHPKHLRTHYHRRRTFVDLSFQCICHRNMWDSWSKTRGTHHPANKFQDKTNMDILLH